MENNNEIVEIPKHLDIIHNGNILNLSSNLLSKENFINYTNIFFFDKYEHVRKEVVRILGQSLNIYNILEQSRVKRLEVIFPKWFDECKHYLPNKWGKNNEFWCMIKEKGQSKILGNVSLAQKLNENALNNITNSINLLTLQNQIASISKHLERIESKLFEIHQEFYNDRIALIQSGYNLFLQSRMLENIQLKNHIQIMALENLNQGREALIRSVTNKIYKLLNKPESLKYIFARLSSGENLKKKYDDMLLDIQESLIYIMRSTQIISIIYQNMEEVNALFQAQARLYDLVRIVDNEIFLKIAQEWIRKGDKNQDFWGKTIPILSEELENFSIKHISKKQLMLDFNKDDFTEEQQ